MEDHGDDPSHAYLYPYRHRHAHVHRTHHDDHPDGAQETTMADKGTRYSADIGRDPHTVSNGSGVLIPRSEPRHTTTDDALDAVREALSDLRVSAAAALRRSEEHQQHGRAELAAVERGKRMGLDDAIMRLGGVEDAVERMASIARGSGRFC